MSPTELRLWAERQFQDAFQEFDGVIYHDEPPDRLVESIDVVHAAVHEMARRELS